MSTYYLTFLGGNEETIQNQFKKQSHDYFNYFEKPIYYSMIKHKKLK